jgi:WD40 repeat protein
MFVWGIDDSQATPRPLPTSGFIRSVAFSPDGKYLAAAGNSGKVLLFVYPFDQAPSEPITHTQPATALAFSSDSQLLASGSKNGKVSLWDISKSNAREMGKDFGEVRALAFSPKGQDLVVASGNKIRWWKQPRSGAGPIELKGHSGDVTALVISPDGATLLSGSMDGTILRWELRKANPKPVEFATTGGYVRALAFSRDGRGAASSHSEIEDQKQVGQITVWNLENLEEQTGVIISQEGTPLIFGETRLTTVFVEPNGKVAINWSSEALAGWVCDRLDRPGEPKAGYDQSEIRRGLVCPKGPG